MGRSSAELSASGTLRSELDRGEDPAILRRLWEQARNHIDTLAGPDQRPELRRLRRLRSNLPMLANQAEVARIDRVIATTRKDLADHARLEALTRPRRFRRPDQHAINETRHRIQAHLRYLRRLWTRRSSGAGSPATRSP